MTLGIQFICSWEDRARRFKSTRARARGDTIPRLKAKRRVSCFGMAYPIREPEVPPSPMGPRNLPRLDPFHVPCAGIWVGWVIAERFLAMV
jgi:hypothetical protein